MLFEFRIPFGGQDTVIPLETSVWTTRGMSSDRLLCHSWYMVVWFGGLRISASSWNGTI